MTSQLAVLEHQLQPLKPRFEAILRASDLSAPRLMQSVLSYYENNPHLHEVALADIVHCAQDAAVVGLVVDSFSGQACILTFNDRRNNRKRAQLVPMYRGYVTIA